MIIETDGKHLDAFALTARTAALLNMILESEGIHGVLKKLRTWSCGFLDSLANPRKRMN